MSDVPDDAWTKDPFHPPSISTLVHCIHCNEEYDSWRIEWREVECQDGEMHGFWCCPVPGCDGRGFGFDIWPVDADWIDPDGREMGWCYDDDEYDEDEEYDEEDEGYALDDLDDNGWSDSSVVDDIELTNEEGAWRDDPFAPNSDRPSRRPPIEDEDIPY